MGMLGAVHVMKSIANLFEHVKMKNITYEIFTNLIFENSISHDS